MASKETEPAIPKPKAALSAFDIAAIVRELNTFLPARVNSVRQLHARAIALELYSPGSGQLSLVMDAQGFIFITRSQSKSSASKLFGSSLAELKGGWLRNAEQMDFDRVVRLSLDDEYSVIFELVGKGNILLTKSGRVLAALDYIRVKGREIRPGSSYAPPPKRGADLRSVVPIAGNTLIQAMSHSYSCPAELYREAMRRLGVDELAPPDSVSAEVVASINTKCLELIQLVQADKLQPVIVCAGSTKINVHPIHFVSEESFETLERDLFNLAVAEYYEPFIVSRAANEAAGSVRAEAERKLATAARTREQTQEELAKAAAIRRVADQLSYNPTYLERLLSPNTDEKGVLSELGFSGAAARRFRGANEIEVSDEKIGFKLRPRESIHYNVGYVYDQAKELERKAKKALEAADKLEAEAKQISEQARLVTVRSTRSSLVNKRWFEKYRWFFSSEGILVVAGRDVSQNEALAKRFMGRDALVAHADIRGASLVVATKGCGDATIREVACYAACYSKGWSQGLGGVDVFYTSAENISLTPPTGEFLPRGSVIFKEKNFIKSVPLRLSVGFSRLEDGSLRLHSFPPSVASEVTLADLVPGETNPNDLAKKLLSLNTSVDEPYSEYLKGTRTDELLPFIPGPSKLIPSTPKPKI
ncbi:MAG: NFACT family protein [Candidatus Marsarchaeota archaeon]|nr:NFACT family protein [Candidatus Marsarchaeota archaeon]